MLFKYLSEKSVNFANELLDGEDISFLELDENNLTVTVEPGVLLMELAKFAETHGFLYPPDPGEKSATIGGNISTNAGGMRAVKYGVTRDYVRGLTVVLPNGEIQELGGKIVKNSSGDSLKDVVIGLWLYNLLLMQECACFFVGFILLGDLHGTLIFHRLKKCMVLV